MNKENKTGKSFPLGATVYPSGVNFSVFAKGGTTVQLLLFDHVDDAQPSRTTTLDPVTNHSHHYWHVFLPGIEAGQIYGYRLEGPLLRSKGCDSIRKRYCSIRMAVRLRARRITAASLQARPAIIVPQP